MSLRLRVAVLPCLTLLCILTIARTGNAQYYSYSAPYSFCATGGTDCTDGDSPDASLIQGTNGNFYGTTSQGGAHDGGTVFEMTPAGDMNILYSFCSQGGASCTDGKGPLARLLQTSDGSLYGTTGDGGKYGAGTVFKLDSTGSFTSEYSFCAAGGKTCADGAYPNSGLVLGNGGNLYGVTPVYGANQAGTIFEITPTGNLTTLYTFCSTGGADCTDGEYPEAELTADKAGNLYGTTIRGGVNNKIAGSEAEGGTVFGLTAGGVFHTIYSFCDAAGGTSCTDGEYPDSAVTLGSDGLLYGTTSSGGSGGRGSIYKVTLSGALTTIHSFCVNGGSCGDGNDPISGMVQASDGNFYGATWVGGTYEQGTFYRVSSSGTFTTIYDFCPEESDGGNCTEGSLPVSAPVQGSDGNFYGTTQNGGAHATTQGESTPGGVFYKVLFNPTGPQNTTTALAINNQTVSVGQTGIFTAKVTGLSGQATGTVKFSVYGQLIGSAPLSSGVATLSLNSNGVVPATYPVVATYLGTSAFASSASAPLEVTVSPSPTATTLKVSPSPVTRPTPVTITATVLRAYSNGASLGATGTPGGSVTFYANTQPIATVNLNSSGVASTTVPTGGVPAGTYEITANYNGDTYDSTSNNDFSETVK